MRQLAINPHSINWTNYSPPVMNTQPIQLTQSLCIAAVVFCTAILMCHHRAAFCRSARLPGKLSSPALSYQEYQVHVQTTQRMWIQMPLCSVSVCRLEAERHHITKTKPNRLTALLIRGNMTPLVLQSPGLP